MEERIPFNSLSENEQYAFVKSLNIKPKCFLNIDAEYKELKMIYGGYIDPYMIRETTTDDFEIQYDLTIYKSGGFGNFEISETVMDANRCWGTYINYYLIDYLSLFVQLPPSGTKSVKWSIEYEKPNGMNKVIAVRDDAYLTNSITKMIIDAYNDKEFEIDMAEIDDDVQDLIDVIHYIIDEFNKTQLEFEDKFDDIIVKTLQGCGVIVVMDGKRFIGFDEE